MPQRSLNFYGYSISVSWPDQFVFAAFRREFTSFDAADARLPSLRITIRDQAVDLKAFPFLRPSFSTPRNICYFHDGKRVINYHGKALVIENEATGELEIIAEGEKLAESILYTIVIAKTGAHFDRLSRFRIHGLAFAVEDKAYLVLLPMGGGKSTLLLQLLRDARVRLLSEDTPLIDAQGRVWPFPIKIGVLPGGVPAEVPAELVTRVTHLEGVEKDVIDLAYLGDRLESQPLPLAGVYVGLRYLGAGTGFRQMSLVSSLRIVIRDCVVGIGVFQGLELILSTSTWNLINKLGLGLRRLYACLRCVNRVPVFEFQMGVDPAANAEELLAHVFEGKIA